jgi:hypothetical protein
MNFLLLIYKPRGVKDIDNVKKIKLRFSLLKTSEVCHEIDLDQNLGGLVESREKRLILFMEVEIFY